MSEIINKIDSNTLEVVKTEVVETRQRYKRRFLREQIQTIKADRDAYVAARKIEIDFCQALIAQMDAMNIVDEKE
jgi:hypothetical protein